MTRSHKVAWILSNGPIPKGRMVCHKCDNPPCCNPSHLFLGTQKDNMQDALAKGRHGHGTTGGPRKHTNEAISAAVQDYLNSSTRSMREIEAKHGIAESHLWRAARKAGVKGKPRAYTIDKSAAEEIRSLYATGEYTYFQLAERFGVTFANIGYIVRGKIWS